MSQQENDNKKLKLFNEYLEGVSSNENAAEYLKEEGFDPDVLIASGLKKLRMMRMEIASQQTELRYATLKTKLLEKAMAKVNEVLSSGSFTIEKFLREENLTVSYRNFDKMDEAEIREFLKQHYLLKLGEEDKKK